VSPETTQVLGAIATLYGLGGALSVLLQARRMHVRGTSGDVSVRFFAVYVGGFAVWLLYGIGIADVPIIVVHAVGLVCGTVTLAVALRLRGPAAVAATTRSGGEDRARARPGQPSSPREPEHRGRAGGRPRRFGRADGNLGHGPGPTSENPLKAKFAELLFHALG
jgi:uncharacterized protein with PQ loop repeat